MLFDTFTWFSAVGEKVTWGQKQGSFLYPTSLLLSVQHQQLHKFLGSLEPDGRRYQWTLIADNLAGSNSLKTGTSIQLTLRGSGGSCHRDSLVAFCSRMHDVDEAEDSRVHGLHGVPTTRRFARCRTQPSLGKLVTGCWQGGACTTRLPNAALLWVVTWRYTRRRATLGKSLRWTMHGITTPAAQHSRRRKAGKGPHRQRRRRGNNLKGINIRLIMYSHLFHVYTYPCVFNKFWHEQTTH